MGGGKFKAVVISLIPFRVHKAPTVVTGNRQLGSPIPSALNHTAGDATTAQFAKFSKLPTELRLKIWRHAFDLQSPRVVEIRTRSHVCTGHKDRCPRYSPSPPPTMALVNLEAREVALKLAEAAGHIFFASSMTFSGDDIFFNPAADTLYIPNEKNQWIHSPDGIMTQFCETHRPSEVQIFALDLNLFKIERTTIFNDLYQFTTLKELVFVVPELKEDVMEQYEAAKADMAHFKTQDYNTLPGYIGLCTENSVKCHLAVKQNGGFKIITGESS